MQDVDIQTTLSVGTLIRERYLVERLIKQSSSGAVYMVVDQRAKQSDEHVFALKEIIGLSEQDRDQLIFDSINLRNIRHEAVTRIHHVFNDDKRNRVYIVMEYVEGPELETVHQQQPEQRLMWSRAMHILTPHSKRAVKTGVPFFFREGRAVPLLLLMLFLLVSVGSGTVLLMQSHSFHSMVVKPRTNFLTLATPVSGSTAPIVTPTSSPGNYPAIVGAYAGTLADISAHVSATVIIQGFHQIGGTINGYFTAGPPFEISGPFRGTIDFSKHFQLTVLDASGNPVIFLDGAIQSATSISGDFYRCTSTPAQVGTCSRASGDYGIWSALLATASK